MSFEVLLLVLIFVFLFYFYRKKTGLMNEKVPVALVDRYRDL